jgi:hypothetical protein
MSSVFDFSALPIEIGHQILNKVSLKDMCTFQRVSKATEKQVKTHLDLLRPSFTFPKASKITELYAEQSLALSILQKTQENLFIYSPMGSGKTLMGLVHATSLWETQKKLTLIVVTAKCLGSWLTHIKLCGWNLVKNSPLDSDVLVYHSSCKKHKDYLEKTFTRDTLVVPEDWKYGIVITTPFYIKCSENPLAGVLKKMHQLGLYQQTIFDEAHLLKKNQYLKRRCYKIGRVIYLSATDFPAITIAEYDERGIGIVAEHHDYALKLNLKNLVRLTTKEEEGERPSFSNVPEMDVVLRETTFEKINSKDLSPIEALEEIGLILKEEFETCKRIILFVNWNPKVFKKRMDILEDIEACKDFEFLRFYSNNTSALDKMRCNKSSKKMVLLVSMLSATEGVNLEMADGALYLDFGVLVPVRTKQCFGRIRRRNNPHPTIKNVLLYSTNRVQDYVRTKLNGYIGQILKFNEVHAHYKSEATINTLRDLLIEHDINIKTLSYADLCSLFMLFEDNTLIEHFPEDAFEIQPQVRMALMSRI